MLDGAVLFSGTRRFIVHDVAVVTVLLLCPMSHVLRSKASSGNWQLFTKSFPGVQCSVELQVEIYF